MSNTVRSWYDFEDIIGCTNYAIGMFRYAAKQSNKDDDKNDDNFNKMLNSSAVNNILSSACCIQ